MSKYFNQFIEIIQKYLIAFLVYLTSYFTPAFPLMLAIGFFLIMDFITGIIAAKKRGEAITSKKMRPTITKGIGYMIAILVAHVFQQNFLKDIEVLKIVSGLIAFIEVKSLDENFRDITGKSLFKQFLKK
jgi:phage-related holin